MVVHNIEMHGDASLVRGFDELFQRVGPAVGILHGELVARIVSPAVPAIELVHRHEQDAVHAHFHQVVEFADRIAQRARVVVRRIRIMERPGVQLIDDEFADRRDGRGRRRFAPIERFRVVDDAALFAGRDLAGARILAFEFAVDEVEVFVPGFGRSDFERPNSGSVLFPHSVAAPVPTVERADDGDRLRIRRPNAEGDASDPAAGSFLDDRAERLGRESGEGGRRRDERTE